jgi:hypothetical protein
MSTTEGQITLLLDGTESLTTAESPGATAQQRQLRTGGKGLNRVTLTSASTPKLDKPLIAFLITGNSGSPTTIDLTAVQAMANPIGSTRLKDLTGAKIKAFLFETDAANVGTVTIAPGGSNPYPLYGAAKDIILGPGRVEASAFKGIESNLAAVAAGAKTITFTFGTTGDKIYVELWPGT